jgi:hypothetical protein
MEEEEIELWYEEQKQKLSEEYIKCIDRGMALEQREVKFNKAMEDLGSKYSKKHASLKKKKEDKKKRHESKTRMLAPFIVIVMFFVNSFRFVGRAVGGGFKTKCGSVKYRASMTWIRNGHKITDGTANTFRPVYYWYVKYLQPVVIAVKRPFLKTGRFFKKKAIQFKELILRFAAGFWKCTKISAKFVAKRSVGVWKGLSAKKEALFKRYHDWQAKRVQAHLDKKHHREEKKKKKQKDKTEKKKTKEGEDENQEDVQESGEVKHPGEAPDVESTV